MRAIDQAEARRLFACIEADMPARHFQAEDIPAVPEYRAWTVVSTSPLLSATHGSMFVIHLANPIAVELYTR